ncbi:MAG: isopeptide-forming domain-containing fimbrial protein [Coriobacteriaceae bacterium]|nr:isopeptide-forming domain-containing fimbrial protein [Coriobacteriaceae bacterium]
MANSYSGMSWRKRTAALIATAALGGAMAVGAVAPASAWAETGTVTIVPQANPDATYQAFQLFKADITPEGNAQTVAWGTGIATGQQNAIATQLDALTENGYTAWLKDKGLTSANDKVNPQNALDFISLKISESGGDATPTKIVNANSFAQKFAKWLQTESKITFGTATANTAFTADEGYYLFVTDPKSLSEGDVATAPIWFALGSSTKTIQEKATAPTVDKDVNEQGGQEAGDLEIGDVLPFKVTATLPSNYGTYDTYKMVLTDTPTNLAIKEGVVVKADGQDITKAEGVTVQIAQGGTKLTVTINDLKVAYKNATAATTVTVEYKAELLPGASTNPGGNKNEVKYEFSNNPNGTDLGEVTDKPVPVYTFLLDMLKVDEKTNEALQGAGFSIKNANDKYYNKDTKKWDLDKATAEQDANLLTTDESGKIAVTGLASGTYTLTEVKAPKGYEAQEGQTLTFTVNVEYNQDGTIKDGAFTVTDASGLKNEFKLNANTGTITATVKNNKQLTLAMTGAEGVGLAGVAVLGLGMAWYLAGKRRKNSDQA